MSTEYEKDAACRSLFMHVISSLRKPYIIVAVGLDLNWKKTSLGFLIGDQEVIVWKLA